MGQGELDALIGLAAVVLFVGAIAVAVLNARPVGAKVAIALFVLAAILGISASLTTSDTATDCKDSCMVGAFPETEDIVLNGAHFE